mmetsp:Transcript_31152/g.67066  ORF Transcript_31152/g.67066 Transcript_31152/m.67066 type:complete len:824 (+) Transcript_31152:38-2509(+)
MSVVGFDLGNSNSVVAVARKRGIDVLANEASKRETASLVGFKDNQRSMGVLASSQQTSNLTNTVSNFKRLLGRKYNDPDVKSELDNAFFKSVEIENGSIGIEVDYNDETKVFSPEQITAMMLTQLRKITETDNNGVKISELVISVPCYFNDAQRRALDNAATIAGVNCVQLLSEPLAVAIPWGMYKKDLPEDDKPLKVMFVNFGESSLWASVVAASKNKLSVLSAASDPNLGGRDFDDVLVNHFAKIIKEEYKIDVFTNKRALHRLRTKCQDVKKVLTTNPEAPLFVESITSDIDVRSFVKKDVFEEASSGLVSRIAAVINRAIADANIEGNLDVVEVVGGASYIGVFQQAVQDAANVQLSHTLNKFEAVARGCALQCAVISPQFHINKKTVLKDYNPYSIGITWTENQESGPKTKSAVLFEKGCNLGVTKKITFKKSSKIDISADYAKPEEFAFSMGTNIFKFSIPVFTPTVQSESDPCIEVTFRLDSSGIFHAKHARAIETYMETVKVPAKKADEKPDAEKKDDSAMETDQQQEETQQVERKKITDIKIEVQLAQGLSKEQIDNLRKDELSMQASDELAIATADARNALEAYSYDTQSKLSYDFSEWSEFATEEEKTKLLSLVDDTLAWLYGDGETAGKDAFDSKLSELKVLGSPIELRRSETETRQGAIDGLKEAIIYYKAFVDSVDEKYAHISAEKRQTVTDKINETEDWLNKMKSKQDELPKTANPVLLTSEIEQRKNNLVIFSNAVVNTPKPKPAPKKPEETKKDDDKMQTDDATTSEEKPAEESKEDDIKPAEEGKIEEMNDDQPPTGDSMDIDID